MADGCESGYFFLTCTSHPKFPKEAEHVNSVADAWTVNEQRTVRVADLLSDFRTLQYWIAAAPVEPENPDDYYTEGWAALRQCSIDGQHILNCAAETRVPRVRGGPEEQEKAELQQYV
jgi:hypothetical protein